MKTKQKRMLLSVSLIASAALVLFCITAGGGSLEPTSPPSPTMHTLNELYNLIGSLGLGSGQLTGPVAAAKVRSLAYMEVDDPNIVGEATDPNHLNWIELLAVNYSAKHPSPRTVANVGGRMARRAEFSDFSIVKEIDKSTPILHLYCAKGLHIPELVIEFTMTEPVMGSTVVYQKVTLKEVVVLAFAPVMSHRTNDEFIHLEEISFGYDEIYWDYTTDGTTWIKAGWSTMENREVSL